MKDIFNTRQRFSIRKFSFGVTSVFLGAIFLSTGSSAQAAEESTPATVQESNATGEAVAQPSQTAPVAPVAVDKTDLAKAIEAAKKVDLKGKTAKSAEQVKVALEVATKVNEDSKATKEQVEKATKDLKVAVEGLVDEATTATPKAVVKSLPKAQTTTQPVAPQVTAEKAETPAPVETGAKEAEVTPQPVTTNISVGNTSEVATTENRRSRRAKRDLASGQPTVEFLDGNGQVIDPNSVFDGKTGFNMQVKVRVTFQENATEKKATIKLGNLLRLIDTGANNDSLKPFLKGASSITKPTVNLTTPDGKNYRNLDNTADAVNYMGDTITYTFNDNVKSAVIPLTISRQEIVGVKGVSTTGEINGLTEGIEKSTPITVESSQKDASSQVVTGTNTFNHIDLKDTADAKREMNTWFNAGSSVPGFEAATTNNDYTVVAGMNFNNLIPGGSMPAYVDAVTFDMVLPKGISYQGLAAYENNFEKLSETTDANGETTLKFKRTNPYYGGTFKFNPKLKVDTTVYTDSYGKVFIKNYNVQLRNYLPTSNKVNQRYRDNIVYGFNIIHLTEKDDIDFFNGRPGVFNSSADSRSASPSNGKQYISLGRFPFDIKASTLDNVNSREKELHYEFPTNPNFEVKGIQLPALDNNNTITKVKVASKKNPTLHEVTLATPFNTAGSYTRSKPRFIDVKDLGLDEDDVLTELVVPIGTFEAGKGYYLGGLYEAKESQVFGKYISPSNNYEVSTKLTLRDKDYNESDPNHNWKTGTGEIRIKLAENNAANDIRVVTPTNKTINYAKSDIVMYQIRSDRDNQSHLHRTTDLIDKAHLVLPEDVDVKSIHLKDQDGNDFTNEATITSRVENGKKIHTIDFSGVSDDKKIIGWSATAGNHFKDKYIKVEVEVENNVASNKTVNYDQTLFVTTPEANVRPQTLDTTVRGVDPYNLVTNKKTIFTNKPVSTFLTLPKADKLDLTTEAKLTTDADYASANDKFRIVDITQDLNLKTSIANKLASEVGEVDMYIPIPKKGQNWGANIQAKAFDYGFNLKGVDFSENPEFANQFDISYATVDESKLNGSLKGVSELKGEAFSSSITPTTNLVRIKSKTGKKIPANSKFPITLTLGLDNVTTAEDGKAISWNAYYQADYASGTTADKGRNIEIGITLGKLGVTFFDDANSNGIKDAGEQTITDAAAAPKIEVYNERGEKENVDKTIEKTATGYVVKGLVTDKNYTVKLISADGTKRFTTGTTNENRSTTTEPIVPTLTSVEDTTLKPVGLTTRVTLTQPDLTTVDNTALLTDDEKTKVETAFKAKNPTLPAGTTVKAGDNGDVTVTYPDGYKEVITNTVAQRATSAEPTLDKVDTDDTKVSGTGVAGATIEVTLPDGTKKTATVGANNKWEVALDAPLAKDAEVKVVQKENDKLASPETKKAVVNTVAANNPLTAPTPIEVDNPAQLTPAEKTAVKDAVKTANPTLPADATIEVKNDGNVEVKYVDGSINKLTPAQTVVARAASATPTVDKVDTDDTKVSGTGVAGATIEVTLPDGTKKTATVGANNKWEVALDAPLAKDGEVKVTQTEAGKKVSAEVPTTVVPTTADTITPANPVKTIVDNPAQLTPAEKTAVKDAVKTANPTLPADATIEVADNGDVTITYADKSVDTIPGANVVEERATSTAPTVDKVDTDDTKVSGTGVAGATIEVTLPDGTKKTATVEQNGKWEVTLDAPLAKDAEVKVVQKEADKKPSAEAATTVVPTTADTITPANPAKTIVDNPAKLTDEEKTAVKDAVKTANPTLPADATIEVADNGDVTITYADKSVDTLPGADVVEERATSTAPTVDKVDTDDTKVSGTGVAGATIEVTLPDGTKKTATVGQNGKWEVALDAPLTKDAEVKVVQKEADKKPSGEAATTVVPTTADTITPANPTKTVVDNPAQLTPAEKTAVKDAVKTANPTLPADATIEVADNGDVTITYADKSVDTIPAANTVEERATSTAPTVDKVDTDDTKVSGTGVAGATIEVTLPDGTKKTATVEQNGKWEVALDAPLTKDAEVKVVQKEADKKPSGEAATTVVPTTADQVTPKAPENKVKVDNPAKLTDEEKAKVAEEVKKANPDLPENTKVEVADNGDVTITYPDKSVDTLPGVDVAVERETSGAPTVDKVDTDDTKVSGTGVAGATIEVTLPDGTKKTTTVGQDGKWEVALDAPLTKDAEVKVVQKEADKKPSAEAVGTVVPTTADQVTPKAPENKVKVDNPAKLTDEEKVKVAEEVKKANPDLPQGTVITVADNGDVTITYPDGSVDTIAGKNTVKAKVSRPGGKADGTNIKRLPNTGATTNSSTAAGLSIMSVIALLGLARRKKENK